jgi:A/G-specific adenine glycosylase
VNAVIRPQDIWSIRRRLVAWYKKSARDLPWRRTRDPYPIWLSEVILQQTRVQQGLPYYERFLAALPDVQSLAAASTQRVLKLWEGMGYYARARNMHRAAQIIAGERKGQFPATAQEWMRLPGVGRYTAGAITSAAFGEPVPIVDGNVARVLCRMFALPVRLQDKRGADALWEIAGRLVSPREPRAFNQAIMELGSQVCRPRSPLCEACPIRQNCAAFAEGHPEKYPPAKPAKKTPHHDMVLAVFIRDGSLYLLRQRPSKGLLGGLWEFPSARIEDRDAAGVIRVIAGKLGLDAEVGEEIAVVRHAFTHFRITVHVHLCPARGNATTEDTRWLTRSELDKYPLPRTHHKFLHLLK